MKNFIALIAISFSVGCAQDSKSIYQSIVSRPEVRAAGTITDSFLIQSTADSSQFSRSSPSIATHLKEMDRRPAIELRGDRYRMAIRHTALEKEFLLHTQLIVQEMIPMFEGQKSRVVAFRKRGNSLYLMEATSGHSVTPDLPQNLILAEFEIVDSNRTWLYFDFNKGMSRNFMQADWHASDFDGADYEYKLEAANVSASYIESAKFSADNKLVVRQIAQLEESSEDGRLIQTPVEARFYFSPYDPDPSFTPTRATDLARLGFFEVAPQLTHEGETLRLATKFHPEQPITYAISSNTPSEYRKAVRDGILYWNRAFGKKHIRVIDAPADVTAPHPDFNVVQWVNWDDAGFAYADAQMDPRSGQIHHAQVFMTSVFALSGRIKAMRLLRQLQESPTPSRRLTALKGLYQPRMCHLHTHHERFFVDVQKMLDTGADDATILKASQDYVREVVAHEIGHTLGLRHNFAGSLDTNLEMSRRDEVAAEYFKTLEKPAGIVPSSSVMDYQNFIESVFSGDIIHRGKEGLSYDEKAIQVLYFDKTFADSDIPAYCADKQVGIYQDCQRFDSGASRVEEASFLTQESQRTLAYKILDTYVNAKSPFFKEQRPAPVEKVNLSVAQFMAPLLDGKANLVQALAKDAKLLRIHRLYPLVGDFNIDEVRAEQDRYLEAESLRLGGLEKILMPIPHTFALDQLAAFEALIDSPEHQKGIGPNGQPYAFTADEIKVMKANVKGLLNELHDALAAFEVKYLTVTKWGDRALTSQIEDFALALAQHYLLALSGETLRGEFEIGGATQTLTLPQFQYPFEIRKQAAVLLSSIQNEAIDWGLVSQPLLKTAFVETLKTGLGSVDLEKLSPAKQPRDVSRWILEQKTLLKGL